VDAPLRELGPDDILSSRPYEGAICDTCNRPTRLVSGPYCRHAIRVRLAMPMPTTLQLSSQQPEDTGSHGMAVYEDHQGDWSLKQPKPSLAFTVPLEAAASTLQRTMGLEAPESYAIEHGGRPAVVSKWYPNSSQAFQKPPPLESLHPDDQMTIQKNHVLDWMIGNHDSHVGNWIRTQDGQLVSIDKGQSAKYFGHDRLDPTFHPNYYARPPIYNRLWNDHAQGRGQMHDPRTGELGQFVSQVQSMPDEKLKDLFRPYAQAAAQSGLLLNPDQDPSRRLGPRRHPANDPEAFLHALVQRKNNLHNDLGEYYDRMSQGRHIVGAGRGRPPLISHEPRPVPIPLEQFGPEPEGNLLHSQTDIAKHMGISQNGLTGLLKKRTAPAPSHYTSSGVPMWDDLRHWDYWRANGGDSPHQRQSGTVHSIKDVSKALGISEHVLAGELKKSTTVPPPSHTSNGLASLLWDDVEPWKKWLGNRPVTNKGRPRKDRLISPTQTGTPRPEPPKNQRIRLTDNFDDDVEPMGPLDVYGGPSWIGNTYISDPGSEDDLLRSLRPRSRPGQGGEILSLRRRRQPLR
jgi:hypothetical protein